MSKNEDQGARLAAIRRELDGLDGGTIESHKEACRLHFETWSIRARLAEEQGDMGTAAVCSKEAREWSARVVHSTKAMIADEIQRIWEALDRAQEFSREVVELKCQTSRSGDSESS